MEAAAAWPVLGVARHLVLDLDLAAIGGSVAHRRGRPVPRTGRRCADIPVTYVPARNTIFLSVALGWAEVLDAADIFIGVNAVDYSGYPDCRPEFIAAFETLARWPPRRASRAAASGPHAADRTVERPTSSAWA